MFATASKAPLHEKAKRDEDEQADEEDMKGMMKKMMGMMKGVSKDMVEVMTAVAKAEDKADKALGLAQQTEKQVNELRTEVKGMIESSVGTAVETKVKDIGAWQGNGAETEVMRNLEAEFEKLKAANVGQQQRMGGSVQGGRSEREVEKRSKTITFGEFPKDTKTVDIKGFIEQVLESVADDIEECFAFGNKFAERGAARFKSKESMWEYMKANAGQHQHTYKDNNVYCNVDSAADPESEQAQKDRAVRKVVRTIIEVNGGDGSKVKAEIDARYKKGVVLWRDSRVAEWDYRQKKMVLCGAGMAWQEHFDKLFRQE